MKKITSLMLMLLCAVTAWAQTELPEMTTDEANPVWYTISNTRSTSGKYLYYTEAGVKDSNETTAASLFYVTGTAEACYIHNYATDKLFTGKGAWNETGVACALTVSSHNTGLMIGYNGTFLNEQNSANGYTEWTDVNDLGSIFVFEKVTDFSMVIDVPAAKEAAKATLENIKGVTVLFNDVKIESAIAAVDAVEAKSNSIEDLSAAVESINAIVANIYTENFTNKNVRFTTQERGVVDITAVAAGGAAQNNSGDAGIWTLKAVKGGFKMYNFASNLWLGATRGQSQRVPTVENEDDAALYVVNSRNGNEINLWNNGNTLHVDGSKNLVQWNDNAAAGGIFVIAEEGEISVTRDLYVNANAAKTTLPYAIQQAYGLVTDASNYFSNYKSTAEGSYEALLDNVETTYFHSAYGQEPGDGTGVHYIQANLGDGNSVDEFYFYMKPRSGNGNNRPVNITVSGSNNNEDFTEIATVTTTLDSSMKPFLSEKLGTEGTKYQYIRLTVTSTNTGTTFFTLSELYFFPATNDVTELVEAYDNLATTSITSADYATYANALVNAETTLALANIKKEVASILAANADNYAETPALGQYTTAAYNALNAAYTAGDATQESLEAAIAAFKKAKNSPVFTISGPKDYVVGKSMYEDEGNTNPKGNDLYFKTTNKYDKTMWWVFDQTTTTVGVTESVAVKNYATGNPVWGVENLKITETSDNDTEDGIFLFYTVGNDTPLHFQADGAVMTRWNSTDKASASAVTFTYLGNTYDLDQLTDEKIAALVALQTAYDAKAFYADAVMGDGLGQYKGDKDAIVAVLPAAETIGAKTLAEQAVLSIDDINAATDALNNVAALAINLPVEGKYYRIQGACEASLKGYYITGHTNADGGRIALTENADASTIYYFDGTNLIAYESGLVVGLNATNWTFASIDDNSKPASTITFAQSPRTVGAYTVKSADRYFHYTVYNGTVQVNRCSEDIHAEHDWYLTEVTTLPVKVTAAGYATFYAPVEVTVPEGTVTAHTVTIDGEWASLSEEPLTTIPANTGVVLANEGTVELAINYEGTAAAIEGNVLAGTVATENVAANAYVLANGEAGIGFYKAALNKVENTKFQNNGHKAYLVVDGADGAAYYSFRFPGTTGVEKVEIGNEKSEIYDLTGRRVEAITAPGIYIVNGKKVLVK